MIGRKLVKRLVAVVVGLGISGSAAAFSYGILAAGVLTAAIAVVAAPFVGVALTAAEIAAVIGTATVHSALAAYVFGNQVQAPPTMPPVMVNLIKSAPATTAKPVKVNLAPMSAAAKTAYQAAKTTAAKAATTTPKPAVPASGQAAAESSARSQVQAGLDYYRNYNPGADIRVDCVDGATKTPAVYNISCNVLCYTSCNIPPFKYATGATVNYTAPVAAVTCPTGSHQVGSICTVDKDPNADSVVNDGSTTPQWNPAGLPDDAVVSADGSTLSRTTANGDGSTTTTNVTLQPDGSLDVVDSTFDPASGKTIHAGYAVDTNGVVQGFAAAASQGNYTSANPATTYPNGSQQNGMNQASGSGGGCGSKDNPQCTIDFGKPDAGPDVPTADSGEADTALKGASVLDSLTKFQLPVHKSECPTMAIPTDFFRKAGTVSTVGACDFVEQNRAALSSVFSLIWVLAALLIVLSA